MVKLALAEEDYEADYVYSTLTYHFTASTGCRPQSSGTSYIYSRASEYAGADHEVCPSLTRQEIIDKSLGWILTVNSFMAHPETLLPMSEIEDPVLRFVSVVKFYLSGWHIKPP